MDQKLQDYEIENLLSWLDKIPFSRPKRKLRRDFSDGVLVAEVVKHFFPKFVDLSSLTVPFNSREEKLRNWNLLNRKVFPKLDFYVPEEAISRIVLSSPGAIEPVLSALREKIDKKLADIASKKLVLKHNKSWEMLNGGSADINFFFFYLALVFCHICMKERKNRMTHVANFSFYHTNFYREKMEKLEHLLQLKDIRIAELTKTNAYLCV
uniref:Sperm flagellar 1 n=1 Tax=Kryptolebias marmoratus TaxID=37003 RepID=A0A3Q3B6M7_KRYMA